MKYLRLSDVAPRGSLSGQVSPQHEFFKSTKDITYGVPIYLIGEGWGCLYVVSKLHAFLLEQLYKNNVAQIVPKS